MARVSSNLLDEAVVVSLAAVPMKHLSGWSTQIPEAQANGVIAAQREASLTIGHSMTRAAQPPALQRTGVVIGQIVWDLQVVMLFVQLLSGHLNGESAGQGGRTLQRDGSPEQVPSAQRNGVRSLQVILGEHPLGPVGSALQDPSLHLNGVSTGHLFLALQSDQFSLQLKSGHTKLVGGQKFLTEVMQLFSADSGKSGSYLQKGLQTLSGQRCSPSGQSRITGQLALSATQSPLEQRNGALAVQLFGRTVEL